MKIYLISSFSITDLSLSVFVSVSGAYIGFSVCFFWGEGPKCILNRFYRKHPIGCYQQNKISFVKNVCTNYPYLRVVEFINKAVLRPSGAP